MTRCLCPYDRKNQQMRQNFLIFFIATLTGCAADRAILPSLEGKPRVKINRHVSAVEMSIPPTKPEERNQNVEKKIDSGQTYDGKDGF